jgi:hypothetical protein
VGKRVLELTLLRTVTQKRKEAIVQEHPGILAREKIETDETLVMVYVVITLKKGEEVMGYEFIENASTFMIEAKAKRYTDILKEGHYLGIVVPGQSRDRALGLRSQFRDKELMNPAFFVYDEYGDITGL